MIDTVEKSITVAQILEHQVLLPILEAGIGNSTIDLLIDVEYQDDDSMEFWDASPTVVRDSESGELALKIVGNTKSSGTGERIVAYFNADGEQVRCVEADKDSEDAERLDEDLHPWILTSIRIQCSQRICDLVDRILAYEYV